MLALCNSAVIATAPVTFTLIKSNAECNSDNVPLGPKTSLQECADACAAAPTCSFFVSGKGAELGHCHQEITNSSLCAEGYMTNEAMDFYALHRTGERGCMDERASNYDAAATEDDGSCLGADTCARHTSSGECANCVAEGVCSSGNDGYVNAEYDTIYAPRVADGAITVDGSLSDWKGHDPALCYKDVAFATLSGDEVVFETFGDNAVWYGRDDFGVKFMLYWDSDNLYLAAEVSDDVLQAGDSCYANGLQAAFEVGGSKAGMPGMLQAQRKDDLDISRLQLLNTGLSPNQLGEHDSAACSTELADPMGCCINFELSQRAGGVFAKKTKAAVLRNPISRVTQFEVAFALEDLIGHDDASVYAQRKSMWAAGLRFGFSFLVNDGDETTAQQGCARAREASTPRRPRPSLWCAAPIRSRAVWPPPRSCVRSWAGYYPHALVHGYNEGQKQPWKAGVVQLGGPGGGAGAECGSCTGWIFFGTFVLAPLFGAAAFGGRYVYQTKYGTRARVSNPLAARDHMGSTPALTVVAPPMSSTA